MPNSLAPHPHVGVKSREGNLGCGGPPGGVRISAPHTDPCPRAPVPEREVLATSSVRTSGDWPSEPEGCRRPGSFS